MSLIPWRHSDLDRFFRDDEWLLPVFSRFEMGAPAMDISETEKEVVAEVNIPDFDPEKIEVSVEDGVLRISGHIDDKKEEKEKNYWRKEIRKGSFERTVRLPAAVNESAVDATYEKGILKIVLPKVAEKPSSRVTVKVK